MISLMTGTTLSGAASKGRPSCLRWFSRLRQSKRRIPRLSPERQSHQQSWSRRN